MAATPSTAAASSPGSPFIRLISSDHHTFVVERQVALMSGMMRSMLSSGAFIEGGRGEVEFPEIPASVLEVVVRYLHYKHKHHNSKVPIPEFVIPPALALEVLMAANYLDC